MRTVAIGDIHGKLDHLDEVLAYVDEIGRDTLTQVIFLGDYCDRGEDSRGVYDRLMRGPSNPRHIWTPLRGNHDQMFLELIDGDPMYGDVWMRHGGDATLRSFGLDDRFEASARKVPAPYREFIANMPLWHEDKHRYFVHAGFQPFLGPRETLDQDPNTIMFIRRAFLEAEHDFGKLVVHGHTPTRNLKPEYLPPYRLCLDTGAGKETRGVVSAAIWDTDDAVEPRFWSSFPGRRYPLTNARASGAY